LHELELTTAGEDEGLSRDLEPSADVLVVTFGGLSNSVGEIPPFEFGRVLDRVGPAKKLFLRDHEQAWYHRGVRGVAPDIEGVAAALREEIDAVGPARTVFLGSSAGGYAALLFGSLLGATTIHVFGAQSFVSPTLRLAHRDARWRRPWLALLRSGDYRRRYGDLRATVGRDAGAPGSVVAHYCAADRLDRVHAERLGEAPAVELRAYPEGGHNVVKRLRDEGRLEPLLAEVLSAEGA
jgi:hypothetical protein